MEINISIIQPVSGILARSGDHLNEAVQGPPSRQLSLVQQRPIVWVQRDVLDDGAADVQQLLLSFARWEDETGAPREAPGKHRVGAEEDLGFGEMSGTKDKNITLNMYL